MKTEEFLTTGDGYQKLAEEIRKNLKNLQKIKIVSGFLTPSGFKCLFSQDCKEYPEGNKLKELANKIEYILIGRLTPQSAELFDKLYEIKEFKHKLFVNQGLGKVEKISKGEDPKINKVEPMVHSKIIFMELKNKDSFIYMGSANITYFALNDLNAEAGIILRSSEKALKKNVESYMDSLLKKESTIEYDPNKKESLIHLSKLMGHGDMKYSGKEVNMTLLILAVGDNKENFKAGDVIYSQLPEFLPDNLKNFHDKIGRNVIILLFPDLLSLLNSSFEKCKVLHAKTGATNDIKAVHASEENNINAMLYFYKNIPPIMIRRNKAPSIKPDMLQYIEKQVKYNIIETNQLRDNELNKIFSSSKQTTLIDIEETSLIKNKMIDRIVIKEGKRSQRFIKYNRKEIIKTPEGEFVEILDYDWHGYRETMKDVREAYPILQPYAPEIQKRFEQLFEILQDPDESKFYSILRDYEKIFSDEFDRTIEREVAKVPQKISDLNFMYIFSKVIQ